jgi:NAD-dependent oxidoreductase involved in siderophore biosynthesis
VAGGLNCYFGCMGGFSECGLSVDCHFLRGAVAPCVPTAIHIQSLSLLSTVGPDDNDGRATALIRRWCVKKRRGGGRHG